MHNGAEDKTAAPAGRHAGVGNPSIVAEVLAATSESVSYALYSGGEYVGERECDHVLFGMMFSPCGPRYEARSERQAHKMAGSHLGTFHMWNIWDTETGDFVRCVDGSVMRTTQDKVHYFAAQLNERRQKARESERGHGADPLA